VNINARMIRSKTLKKYVAFRQTQTTLLASRQKLIKRDVVSICERIEVK
jgi:hypothetical protein